MLIKHMIYQPQSLDHTDKVSHDSHVTKMAEIVTRFSELVRHRISTRE